ncbi:SDR family NAD(P)-dependent oxidoreductase, partial [Streptomyces sp. tea 10]|nr:SDR family NAD(P)-dependent oxidoreductase [Streptomyces sp. tea 10]
MRIENTIVLVTGGARGLGEHLSRAFAREGARVVVNYHSSEERARSLVRELGEDKVIAVRADVT